MKPVHFEDLVEGHVGESSEVFADRDDMVAYAERNDPYPIHVDEQFAATSPFGGLVASFGYTVSLYLRIIHDMELFWATGSTFLGVLECRSRFAARSGQATAYTSAGRYRASGSRAGATGGVMTSRNDVLNQHDGVPITTAVVWLIATRQNRS